MLIYCLYVKCFYFRRITLSYETFFSLCDIHSINLVKYRVLNTNSEAALLHHSLFFKRMSFCKDARFFHRYISIKYILLFQIVVNWQQSCSSINSIFILHYIPHYTMSTLSVDKFCRHFWKRNIAKKLRSTNYFLIFH